MIGVFVLWHTHGDDDDHELVGVYSSRERALGAVLRLRTKPGFRDAPEVVPEGSDDAGFLIIEYQLDEDHWIDGHVPGDMIMLETE